MVSGRYRALSIGTLRGMMESAMDAQVAHLILYSITAVAVLVWLAGLRFLVTATQEPRVDRGFDASEPSDRLPIRGTAEVDGEPESLALLQRRSWPKEAWGQWG